MAAREELEAVVTKMSEEHAAALEAVESEHEEAVVMCNDKLEETVEG